MRRSAISGLTTLAALLAFPANAQAWSFNGHTIVCDIAFKELNPTARAEVVRLLADGRAGVEAAEGKPANFSRFADSCVWPDTGPKKRRSTHFINTSRDTKRISSKDCGARSTCLFTGIDDDAAVLKSDAGDREKLVALMYLGHWVGDLHQPLHVSYADDKGGNDVKEQGGPCRSSLHSVWDRCIIEQEVGTDLEAVADRLHGDITDAQRTEWQRNRVTTWANESYTIATKASVEYCIWMIVERDDGSEVEECWYSRDLDVFPDNADDDEKRAVTVGPAYRNLHEGIVERRLKQAGFGLEG